MAWSDEEVQFLIKHYPDKGKVWCAKQLSKTTNAVRNKASLLGLKANHDSDHFRDWQNRAAKSKVGKKRPDHSSLMKSRFENGDLTALTDYVSDPKNRQLMSDRTKSQFKEKGHPRGALGMKHTEDTRKVISQKSKEAWLKKTEQEKFDQITKQLKTREQNGTLYKERSNSSWKAGWREIGGANKYYRSRWEANYARVLQAMLEAGEITKWEHEPITFWFDGIKRGVRSFLPDFRVTNLDGSVCFHEVKGWMDAKSKTKIKRMAKYHPNVVLVVIDAPRYRLIAREWAAKIHSWEE